MRRAILIGLFLLGLLVCGTAKAATIGLSGLNTNGAMIQQVSTNLGNEYMGSLSVTWDSRNYLAYCVDLYSAVGVPGTMNANPRPMSELPSGAEVNPPQVNADTGRRVAWLYNTYQLGGLISNVNQASALQAAIWEVLYDWTGVTSSLNMTSGNFYLTNAASPITTTAQSYLTALDTNTYSGSNVYWLDTNIEGLGNGQDFVVGAVPAPAAIALLGLGSVGLAFLRRRKAQKA